MPSVKQEMRSQALNLALMFHRQLTDSTVKHEDEIVQIADKFLAFLEGRPAMPPHDVDPYAPPYNLTCVSCGTPVKLVTNEYHLYWLYDRTGSATCPDGKSHRSDIAELLNTMEKK